MHSYCGAQAKKGHFQEKEKHTSGTNPVVAYGIVLQCVHQPPLLDYHTGSCSPTFQNKRQTIWISLGQVQYTMAQVDLSNVDKENLLKTCSIHAHDKLKYSLAGGFNHANSLHCSATASCL